MSEKNIYYVNENLNFAAPISAETLFSDYAAIWLTENRTELSPKTYTRYQTLLERINLGIGHIPIGKLTSHHLIEFYSRLRLNGVNKRTGGSLSPKTVLHHHRLISSILHNAVRERILEFNPASSEYMKVPYVPAREVSCLQIKDIEKLIMVLKSEQPKWRALIYILIFTGVRRGEALGIEWHDIDFDRKTITVRRSSICISGKIITKEPKTSGSHRSFSFLSDELLGQELLSYKEYYNLKIGKEAEGKRLFVQKDGRPMHPDSLNDFLKKLCLKNNLPHITSHMLRHTHVSMLIALGVPIKEISLKAGHSQLSTTCNTYAHFIELKNIKPLPTVQELLGIF